MAHKYRAKITKRPYARKWDWELQRMPVVADTWTNYVNMEEEPEWVAIAWGWEPSRELAETEARQHKLLDDAKLKAEAESIYIDLE